MTEGAPRKIENLYRDHVDRRALQTGCGCAHGKPSAACEVGQALFRLDGKKARA